MRPWGIRLQRLAAFVLSVLWTIGAVVYVWQNYQVSHSVIGKVYYHCLSSPDSTPNRCDERRRLLSSSATRLAQKRLLMALVLIPIAWLLV